MFSSRFYPQDFHTLVDNFAIPYSTYKQPVPNCHRRIPAYGRGRRSRPSHAQYVVIPAKVAEPDHHDIQFDPRVYFEQTESAYTILAEVPGFTKEQVSVELSDHETLSITGSTLPKQTEMPTSATLRVETEEGASSDVTTNSSENERPLSPKRTSIEEVRDESEREYIDVDLPLTAPGSPIFTEPCESSPKPTQVTSLSTSAPNSETTQQQPSYQEQLRSRSFEKSFRVPQDVDREHVSAELRDGLLRIKLLKLTPNISRRTIRIV